MVVSVVHVLSVILGTVFAAFIVPIGDVRLPAGAFFFPFAFAAICVVREVWSLNDAWKLVGASCSVFLVAVLIGPLIEILPLAPGFHRNAAQLSAANYVEIGGFYVLGEFVAVGVWHLMNRLGAWVLVRILFSIAIGQLAAAAFVWPLVYLGNGAVSPTGRTILFRIVMAFAMGGGLSLIVLHWAEWIREHEYPTIRKDIKRLQGGAEGA